MSTYLADELRRAIDLPSAQQTIRMLEIAVMIERVERVLNQLVQDELDEAQSLRGLIRRCNAE